MSWFSKHFGITLNSHSLPNLLKDVAPAAAFTPLGVLGAGGLAALGDLGRGKNIGQALKSGVENAALGGGLASLGTKVGLGTGAHLGFGLGEGGSSAGAASSAASPSASAGVTPGGTAAGALAPTTAAPFPAISSGGIEPASSGALSLQPISSAGIRSAPVSFPAASNAGLLSKVGGFVEGHPNTVGLGLQGLGGIASAGADSRLKAAQASALEASGGLTADERAARSRNAATLSPYFSALSGSIKPNTGSANPYATTGG